MMIGNSRVREDLERTVNQMYRLSHFLIIGIPHRHRLFNHYFNDRQTLQAIMVWPRLSASYAAEDHTTNCLFYGASTAKGH